MTRGTGIQAFQPGDLERLDRLLHAFLHDTGARCAILMDRTGRLLTSAGDTAGFDGITFASLAAADFAASDQLAMLLGEEEFSTLYHQGDDRSMYLADVGGHAILAALFGGRTTLGMVRLKAKAVAPHFAALFAEVAARQVPQRREGVVDWAAAAADEIDRLFAD
ncbi:MAG TPA: roadblock/LC7 domain-containing protein [Longimicrobiales bacterium]